MDCDLIVISRTSLACVNVSGDVTHKHRHSLYNYYLMSLFPCCYQDLHEHNIKANFTTHLIPTMWN